MAEVNIASALSSLRRLFPDVSAAVEQYREARPSRESRNLARRLKTEEALYDQFRRQMLLLLSSAIPMKSNDRLSRDGGTRLDWTTAENLRSSLDQMERFLGDLKANVMVASRGTEVLAKFKHKTSGISGPPPINPLQKRMDALSRANNCLTAYLWDGKTALPLVRDSFESLDFQLLFDPQKLGEANVVQVREENHADGFKPLAYRGGGPWANDSHRENHETSLKQRHQHISVSVQPLDQRIQGIASASDICSNINTKDGEELNPHYQVDSRTFRLRVNETNLPSTVISFKELISRIDTGFDLKRRMELAFRLSSMLLILWSSPSMFNSSTWKDWVVWFDAEHNDGPWNFYLCPSAHLKKDRLDEGQLLTPTFLALTRDPVLSLLGLRLVELAFGQTLEKLRKVDLALPSAEESLDENSMDLLTARRLLALHRIADKTDPEFEDVVNACLNQQYRERKGAQVIQIDTQNHSFLERATLAILLPLHNQMRKNSGFTYNAARPNATKQSVSLKKELQDDGDESRQVDQRFLPATSGLLTGAVSQYEPQNRAPSSLSTISADGGSKDVISFGKPPRETRPRPTESSGDQHEPNNNNHDAHRPGMVSICSRYPSTFSTSRSPYNTGVSADKERLLPTNTSAAGPETESGFQVLMKPQSTKSNQYDTVRSNDDISPRGSDDGFASVDSYDTMTMTTDSAFAWQSDHTGQLPEISENHPLWRFRGIALLVLMRHYQSWRQYGNDQVARSGSAFRSETSKKRIRSDFGEPGDENDDIDDFDSHQGPPSVSNKKRRVKEEPLIFACPFFKKNAADYSRCCQYQLKRIRDIKQHFKRCHLMPQYCARCWRTFRTEDERDDHSRGELCEVLPPQKPEGITVEQQKMLSKKVSSNQSPEHQWFGIFDILFPGHSPRPASPYIDAGFLGQVDVFHTFSRSYGPRIMGAILDRVVTWHLPDEESDMQAFQHSILGDGFREIYNQWISSEGRAVPEPNQRNPTTQPMSRARKHTTQAPEPPRSDTERQSVDTPSYFTSTSSSHMSSNVSMEDQSGWLAGPRVENAVMGGFSFDIDVTNLEPHEEDEIRRLSIGFQDPNMRF